MDIEEELKEEYRKVFSIYDRDDTGAIATEDLGNALRAFGCNPTEEEVDDLVNEAMERVNDNGKIEFDDFCDLMSKRTKSLDVEERELMDAFRVFDKNRDGTLNKKELSGALSSLGMTKMSDEDLDEFFAEVDEDEDGAISYPELVKVIMGNKKMASA